jgi:hypothetical protein
MSSKPLMTRPESQPGVVPGGVPQAQERLRIARERVNDLGATTHPGALPAASCNACGLSYSRGNRSVGCALRPGKPRWRSFETISNRWRKAATSLLKTSSRYAKRAAIKRLPARR